MNKNPIDTTTWNRVKRIFSEALERPAAERAAFLDDECKTDAELRAQVDALLAAEAEQNSFLAAPTRYLTPDSESGAETPRSIVLAPSERPGATIDRYKLLQLIGEGGFGSVYMAEQKEPVKRKVALKVIKLGMDTKQVIARFEAERQALAMMDHPNIAKVLDAGSTAIGRPYFVMELVRGVPFTEYCDTHHLSARERLELFVPICNAAQHAHQKGIIHRDIKPSNVMVTLHDGVPVPKVIDFGIAKAMDRDLTDKTLFTEYSQLVGTPTYMSPEQAEMSGLDIDTRSDIYSLGVLLYEVLTGTTPFDFGRLRKAAYGEMQRIIREEVPAKPSTRLKSLITDPSRSQDAGLTDDKSSAAAIASDRRTDPVALSRLLRDDLDWIVMKSLEKDRTRRYQSASELAADIGRHLNYEPVLAGPPGAAYRMKKFLRKNQVLVTASAAVLVALVAGLITTWTQYRRAETNAQESRDLAALANTRYEEIIRLADLKRLADARAEADDLWPAHPEKIAALEAWIETRAKPLHDNLPRHRKALGVLRERALDYDPDQRTWKFADNQIQWQHDTLTELVTDLETFSGDDPTVGTSGSVATRLAFARTIATRSVTGTEARAAWEGALREIRDSDGYGRKAKAMNPQIGLLPLGADPRSGLQEFLLLQTHLGKIPVRDAEGNIAVTAELGLVFVLVPGGTFWMGAQSVDAARPNHDSHALSKEGPPHQVTLDPFFISKYEMTQAQWEGFTGQVPSEYQISGRNPVERVSWTKANATLRRLGLVLPTEAQWEYAARGGGDTVWWSGNEKESIFTRDSGNLNDESASSQGAHTNRRSEPWEDRWVHHAPVGNFAPNPYGLHDVIGNVWEWCRDGLGSYDEDNPAAGDGERRTNDDRSRVLRGGSFLNPAPSARSANRDVASSPEYWASNVGFRPCKSMVP